MQYSHFDLEAVRRLVSERPALAIASWDWGFGDWESPIGAASHVGRRPIAEFLLAQGARPDVFTFAMLGNVDAVRAMIEARPGLQRTTGPHGLSLLHHAKAGGADAGDVVSYLEELGDADPRPTDLPLSADARRAYLGTYRYEIGVQSSSFQIIEQREHIAFRYDDEAARMLLRQGQHEFHPVGAPAVRFRFDAEGEGIRAVTIRDGAESVVARRAG